VHIVATLLLPVRRFLKSDTRAMVQAPPAAEACTVTDRAVSCGTTSVPASYCAATVIGVLPAQAGICCRKELADILGEEAILCMTVLYVRGAH